MSTTILSKSLVETPGTLRLTVRVPAVLRLALVRLSDVLLVQARGPLGCEQEALSSLRVGDVQYHPARQCDVVAVVAIGGESLRAIA